MNRCYETHVYVDAVKRLKMAGLNVVTHMILGLPGDTEEDMLETPRLAVRCGTDGVKFHLLHGLKNTSLEHASARALCALHSCLSAPSGRCMTIWFP